MTPSYRPSPEFERLLDAMCEDELTVGQARRLEEIVTGNDDDCWHYLCQVHLHGTLHWNIAQPTRRVDAPWGETDGQQRGGVERQPAESGFEIEAPITEPLIPPAIVLSSLPSPPLSTIHYPLSTNFVGGPVFSYMVSAVIVGMMLLGAWAYKISHYRQIAATPSVSSSTRPELVFVGRITGMADCRWADPQTEAFAGSSVPLDRKYALASGLMEITYVTGAKVILQGPCTYEVESRRGGYLALGKLTARIEERREKREEGGKPQAANLQISNPNPQSLTPTPLFAIRTPIAIVTDLGTEFGVEVSAEGNTTSHVFCGSVKVQVVAPEKGTGPICAKHPPGRSGKLDLSPFPTQGVVLRENESARVEKGAGGPRLVLGSENGDSPKFVRRLYEPPKLLDLLDIVAGGNGLGKRRERGIDPATGKEDPWFSLAEGQGNRKFRRVTWHRIIDGVFVPDRDAFGVQLDSAGHTFDGFGRNAGKTIGSIWSRGADLKPFDKERNRYEWVYSIGGGDEFMPERRGLLCLHANAGITFDLAALRELYRDVRPKLFRATAGVGDSSRVHPESDPYSVDFWVFVDGRVKFKRKSHTRPDGVFEIEVELGPDARFLTLMATDSDGRCAYDWSVFGDPVLEMIPATAGKPSAGDEEQVKHDSQSVPRTERRSAQ